MYEYPLCKRMTSMDNDILLVVLERKVECSAVACNGCGLGRITVSFGEMALMVLRVEK